MASLTTTLADPLWSKMGSGCKKGGQTSVSWASCPDKQRHRVLDFPGGRRVPSEIYKHIYNKWEASFKLKNMEPPLLCRRGLV